MNVTTYGLGGFCADCNPSHDHPQGNVVAITDVGDPTTEPVDSDSVIASVAAMTDDQKAALRAALGLS